MSVEEDQWAALAPLANQHKIPIVVGNIDRKVAEVDLRDHFVEWWGLLAKPIQLADGVWLVLGPQRLRMGAVSGRDKVLTVPVSLDARPRIVTGRDEPAAQSVRCGRRWKRG